MEKRDIILNKKLEYCVEDLCKRPNFSIVEGYIKTMTGGSYGLLCQMANMDKNKLDKIIELKYYPTPKDVEYDIFILTSPKRIPKIQTQINQMFNGTVLEEAPLPSKTKYTDYEDDDYKITVISRYHYNSIFNKLCTFNIIYINNIINVKKAIDIDPKYYKEIIQHIWYNLLLYRYRIVANERTGKKLINDYIRVGIASNFFKQNEQTVAYWRYANSINLPELHKAKEIFYNMTNKNLIPIHTNQVTYKFNNKSKRTSRRKSMMKSRRKSMMKSRRKSIRKSRRKSIRKSRHKSIRKSRRKSIRKSRRKSIRKSRRKSIRKSRRKSMRKSRRKSINLQLLKNLTYKDIASRSEEDTSL